MIKAIISSILFLTFCYCNDSDPYDCDKRGPLVVSDVDMKDGKLNQYYNYKISKTEIYIERIVDTTQIPPGLTKFDSLGLYLRGIPTTIGNYQIQIKVSEFGTYCVGRTAYFNANINILN